MQGLDVDPGNLMPEYTLWNITVYCFLWIKIPRITWMALQILCGYWRHTLYLFIFWVAIALLTFSACEAVWVGGGWVQSGEKCLLWIVCCYTLWSPSCVSVPDNGASWLIRLWGMTRLKKSTVTAELGTDWNRVLESSVKDATLGPCHAMPS